MHEKLNAIIKVHEVRRSCRMPRIGPGHAGFPGGIFILLQDPGGKGHTPGSGPLKSGMVDIYNDDATARWTRELLERLSIPKSGVTPWNTFGAFDEQPSIKSVKENLPLCRELIIEASPAALVAQGRWANEMVYRLCPAVPVFLTPHPSRRGRVSRPDAEECIRAAYIHALRLMRNRQARNY